MASLASKDREWLARMLYDSGSKLSKPSQSKNDALAILKGVEECLILVEQSPPNQLQIALAPIVIYLDQHKWLRHKDDEVRLLVTICLSEILRILAP